MRDTVEEVNLRWFAVQPADSWACSDIPGRFPWVIVMIVVVCMASIRSEFGPHVEVEDDDRRVLDVAEIQSSNKMVWGGCLDLARLPSILFPEGLDRFRAFGRAHLA